MAQPSQTWMYNRCTAWCKHRSAQLDAEVPELKKLGEDSTAVISHRIRNRCLGALVDQLTELRKKLAGSETREADTDEERRFTDSRSGRSDEPARTNASGRGPVLSGYAALYDSVTDIGHFREVLGKGAFAEVLRSKTLDVMALFNHDANFPLARTGSGLTLKETARGLWSSIKPVDSMMTEHVVACVRERVVTGQSFGFIIGDLSNETWAASPDGTPLRRILRIEKMLDVSVVTFPAYSATSVDVGRSANPDRSVEDLQLSARIASLVESVK